MIVIGYQGVGKTTLCRGWQPRFISIDLESSWWKDELGNRPEKWVHSYCKVAEELSKQGYVVFISSHKAVQDRLRESEEKILAVYPSQELKQDWIEKLTKRFRETGNMKDFILLRDAEENYDKEIKVLENSPFIKNPIRSMTYRIGDILLHHMAKGTTEEEQNNVETKEDSGVHGDEEPLSADGTGGEISSDTL